jgi:hypothetical protein
MLRNGLEKLIGSVTIAVLLIAFTGTAKASEGAINPNLVVNPEAEMGLEGWNSSDFAAAPFGSSPSVPPTPLGRNLFVAQVAGATMSQVVSFARYTSSIEAGTEPVGISAALGSAGAEEGGAELLVQPQAANGEPLGSAVQLGPATAADRQDGPTLVGCWVQIVAPRGMRSVSVTLRATGKPGSPSTAMANAIYVSDLLAVADQVQERAQGPNCWLDGTLANVRPPGPTEPRHSAPGGSGSTPPPSGKSRQMQRKWLAKVLTTCRKLRPKKKRTACIAAAKVGKKHRKQMARKQ